MIGIGVDVVEIERFRRPLARTPSMRERLFTPIELDYVAPEGRPGAVAGGPLRGARGGDEGARARASARSGSTRSGSRSSASGAPRLRRRRAAARELAVDRGVVRWHLSLSHDGPVAVAMVVAE